MADAGKNCQCIFTPMEVISEPFEQKDMQLNAAGYSFMPFTVAGTNAVVGALRLHMSGPENGQRVLFIHGMTFFAEMYTTFLNKLNTTHRVLALDLPGHGRSHD